MHVYIHTYYEACSTKTWRTNLLTFKQPIEKNIKTYITSHNYSRLVLALIPPCFVGWQGCIIYCFRNPSFVLIKSSFWQITHTF